MEDSWVMVSFLLHFLRKWAFWVIERRPSKGGLQCPNPCPDHCINIYTIKLLHRTFFFLRKKCQNGVAENPEALEAAPVIKSQ